MPIGRMTAVVFLLLSLSLVAQFTPPTQTAPAPTVVAAGEISPVEGSPQTGSATTKVDVGLILGNFLILCLYSFPMSIGEGWALSDPMKAKKQPKTELPETIEKPGKPTLTIGDEAQASTDDRTMLFERVPIRVQKLPRVAAGLVGGGCLMAVAVVLGAVAFALYYLFSDQPEKVSELLPWFAYWFPFALLGLVTDVPFQVFDWEDRRLRVSLRLILWWFPRLIIVAFMFNLPFLQDLDAATTALAVLAIDGVLTVFFLWLYKSREKVGMKDVQQNYDTYEEEIA